MKKTILLAVSACVVFAVAPCPIHNYESASFGAKIATESLISQHNQKIRSQIQNLIKEEEKLNTSLKQKLLISKKIEKLYEMILIEKEKQVLELQKKVKILSLKNVEKSIKK